MIGEKLARFPSKSGKTHSPEALRFFLYSGSVGPGCKGDYSNINKAKRKQNPETAENVATFKKVSCLACTGSIQMLQRKPVNA